jgi:hypothetical protein
MGEKKCPITTSGTGDSSFMDCQKENCGMWNHTEEGCSIKIAANSFGEIAEGLNKISKSLELVGARIGR